MLPSIKIITITTDEIQTTVAIPTIVANIIITIIPLTKTTDIKAITELELLGIVFACQKFRVYILGFPINVYTDHQALIFLSACKLRTSRLSRWTLLLQEYQLNIVHYLEKSNPLDTLSRYPVGRDESQSNDSPILLNITAPPTLPLDIIKLLKKIFSEQLKYLHLFKMYSSLSKPELKIPWHSTYQILQNTLFIRNSLTSSSWSIFPLI